MPDQEMEDFVKSLQSGTLSETEQQRLAIRLETLLIRMDSAERTLVRLQNSLKDLEKALGNLPEKTQP